jgi:multicomponent Na+:H+ antiporter subunit G
VNLLCAILLIAGASSCLLGALGLVRFPDLLSRLQAATKPQTLGLLLILLGTALRLDVEDAATLGLVALFQVLTAPVISQLIGRSAYRAGSTRRDLLVVDELGARLSRERPDRTD